MVNVWSGSEALALLGSVVSPLGGRKAQGEEVWSKGDKVLNGVGYNIHIYIYIYCIYIYIYCF